MEFKECKEPLTEIERIGKHVFVVLDAWRNNEGKKRMMNWNLIGRTLFRKLNIIEIITDSSHKREDAIK